MRAAEDEASQRRSRLASGEAPPDGPTYLAVDLEVRSRRSLGPLLAEWPQAQTPGRTLGTGPKWLVITGMAAPGMRHRVRDTADSRIGELVAVIEALPQAARRCWDEAISRTFDIGIEAPPGPTRGKGIPISQRSVEAMARVGGKLVVTVYPPTPD